MNAHNSVVAIREEPAHRLTETVTVSQDGLGTTARQVTNKIIKLTRFKFIFLECEPPYWGKRCLEDCLCDNGLCDFINGSCDCYDGWIGATCNQS